MNRRLAILLPCYNEAVAIADVVAEFRRALPEATIYVYDNDSSDRTGEIARKAQAIVRVEPLRGKGHVVRRMFADIEADIYVMADGDGTYDANAARAMVDMLIDQRLDMVVGRRVADNDRAAYRPGHHWGNRALSAFVARLFGDRFTDIFSGYRAMSRRFVKSFPSLTTGFEIETELTVHALELFLPVAETPIAYRARPSGSASKLSTWRDGLRILLTIATLYRNVRPLQFFGGVSLLSALTAIVLAQPLLTTYLETGMVPRFPTAVLATGIMLLAFLSLGCGLILDSVSRWRREMKRLMYLQASSREG